MISAIAKPTTAALKQTIRPNPIGLSSIVQVQPRLVAGAGHDVFSDTPDRRQAQKSEYDRLDRGRHVPGPGTGWLEQITVELNCIERYRDVWLKPEPMAV
jgi:hypothetical protein